MSDAIPVKHGTVFLTFADDHPDTGTPGWWGYWDSAPDNPPSRLESAGFHSSPQSAVNWGSQRSDRIVLRVPNEDGNGSKTYWAGSAERPSDIDEDWTS